MDCDVWPSTNRILEQDRALSNSGREFDRSRSSIFELGVNDDNFEERRSFLMLMAIK
jgi:hypothetical protein